MKLPKPRETLAGCIWLPRILAKARQLQSGELASEYAARFCHPTGVDGAFITHFALTREEVLHLAALPDAEVVASFLKRHTPESIQAWNHAALNLGRPGFPLAERFPVAAATAYQHVATPAMTTIFELLEADEAPA